MHICVELIGSVSKSNYSYDLNVHQMLFFSVNSLDGAYNIIGRTCAFGRGGLEDHGVKDCHLQEDGNGYCYCNTDNCNVIPKSKSMLCYNFLALLLLVLVLTNNASRITCYHCDGEQCNDDQDNFGIEVTCPIGVKRCVVTGNQWNDRFYRSCEWELHAENSDSFGDEQGYCLTMDDPHISHMCTCSTDKCNTGFHGPKCHVYKASNCGTKGPRIMGLDDESEPSVMNCLTGTKYCGSSQIGELHSNQYFNNIIDNSL